MKPITLNHFGRRTALIQMLAERGAKTGVEVGSDHGKYARQICEGVPNLQLYLVDPWKAYTEGDQVHTQEEVDQIYEEAKSNVSPYNAPIMRMTSMEAVKEFNDNYLDFVFIDGNHDFEHCYEDIVEWTKKVKPGGIVCGHDYKVDPINNYGVIEAVEKYTKENHIAPLFILHSGGKLVDCWMFIKQPI